jgi:hypothetical protein
MLTTMPATVAMLVTLGVLLTAVSLTFASEPKRDILGFRPGMPYAEAMSLAAKVCKDKLGPPPWGSGNSPTTSFLACSLGTRQVIGGATDNAEENLVFIFGNGLPKQSLISVSYHFAKPQPDTDLNRYVTRFGVPVSCLSAHACHLNPAGLYLSFAEGKTISKGLLFLIDNQLLHENEERWKKNNPRPSLSEGNGEESQNLENSIVIFPQAATSTSSPNDIRKGHRGLSADRKTPGADFRDSALGVPMIIREERR